MQRSVHLASLVTMLVVVACSTVTPSLGPSGRTEPSTSVAPSTPPGPLTTPSPTEAPPTQSIGEIVDGVPTSLDGQAVLRGDAMRNEIKRRADATPFLVGGWFRGVDERPMSCTLFRPPPEFDTCREGFRVYDSRTGPWLIRLAVNDPPRFDPSIAYAQERPVVLRIHTHDPACAEYDPEPPENCENYPVLDELAWLGPPATEPPIPTVAPTQPTGGLTRRGAIDRAREQVANFGWFRLPVACVAVGLYSELFGSLNGGRDPWVWVVVFEGEGRHNHVVMTYVSGKFLEGGSGTGRRCDDFGLASTSRSLAT